MERQSIFLETKIVSPKKEKLKMFLDRNKYTDCTFILEEKPLSAHKIVLASCSDVFEKMFYGDLPPSREVYIRDIHYDDFKQVLNFIYTDKIQIDSVAKAWQLYYIAHKYSLDDLSIQCLSYIKKYVTMSSLVLCYEYAEMYNLDEREKWFVDIVNYAKGVFECEYHMKSSTLKRILDEDNFKIDSLCSNILEWCANECKFKRIAADPDNIVNLLGQLDILKYIKKKWLYESKCDRCDFCLIICECFGEVFHNTLLLLDSAMDWETANKVQNKIVKYPFKLRKDLKIAQRLDLDPQDAFISTIMVDVNTIVFGFLVSTVMSPGIDLKEYDGCITIRICYENSDIMPPTTVKDVMLYDDEYYVALRDLAYLKAKTEYTVKISYGNLCRHRTSVTCHFMSSVLYNDFKHSIEFKEMCGTVIKGVTFYPE